MSKNKSENPSGAPLPVKVIKLSERGFILKTETAPEIWTPIELGATNLEVFRAIQDIAAQTQQDIIELSFAFSAFVEADGSSGDGKIKPVVLTIGEFTDSYISVVGEHNVGVVVPVSQGFESLYYMLWADLALRKQPLSLKLRIDVHALFMGNSLRSLPDPQ